MFPRMCVYIIVLIYVVIVAETQDVSPVLQRRKTNYLNFAGKTYYFGIIFKANFFRALQFCRQQGMQLVSISSQVENERLARFAEEIGTQFEFFWTSGTSLAEENQWIWLSTGNNLIYSNWRAGEPSGKGPEGVAENCLELEVRHGKGFTWNDVACDAQLNFICETVENCSK